MVEKLNDVLKSSMEDLEQVKKFLRFKEPEYNDNWDTYVKSIDIDSNIEISDPNKGKGLLHAHCSLRLCAYFNMLIDIPILNKMLDEGWGSHLRLYISKAQDSAKNMLEYNKKQQELD